ncbi:MAG: response regulator [Halieaceae bacterium]|nr:response regulator [Halieaceae bacterium]
MNKVGTEPLNQVSGRKVVVVEDEEIVREVICASLELDGHQVFEAEDGLAGLALIKNELPDLILSDIDMPGMNGIDLFEAVRAPDSGLKLTPFVFLSGKLDGGDAIAHLNGGADGCFSKPISMSLLRAHINSILAASARNREYTVEKLDRVANALPADLAHNNGSNSFRISSIDEYTAAIFRAVREQCQSNNSDRIEAVTFSSFVLREIEAVQEVMGEFRSELLTLWLVFTVAKAEFEKRPCFVTDLYVGADAAKTTVNSRINALLDRGVFHKSTYAGDARRFCITLNKEYEPIFSKFLDGSYARFQALGSQNQ